MGTLNDLRNKCAIHYQEMQRFYHDASVRAMEISNPEAAKVFQEMAAEYYVRSVKARDALYLTTAAQ